MSKFFSDAPFGASGLNSLGIAAENQSAGDSADFSNGVNNSDNRAGWLVGEEQGRIAVGL
jgi:hypothetical protein